MEERIQDFTQWLRLKEANWNSLYDKKYLVSIKAREIIYNQGEQINHIYIIKSGRLGLTMLSEKGKGKTLLICEQGSLFGDCALTKSRISLETASAAIASEIYKYPIVEFEELIKIDAIAAQQLIRFLATKASILQSQIEDICFMDAKDRICRQLLKFAFTHGEFDGNICSLNLKFTHQQMAEVVGISRVMVSNIFSELYKSKVIRKKDGFIIINDIGKLRSD